VARGSFEIRTVDEFRAVAGLQVGAIVIMDNANETKAHRPSCRHVSEEAFAEKVITNRARNGRYFFLLRLADAEREFAAARCSVCR
jgi:hypothetical protein